MLKMTTFGCLAVNIWCAFFTGDLVGGLRVDPEHDGEIIFLIWSGYSLASIGGAGKHYWRQGHLDHFT